MTDIKDYGEYETAWCPGCGNFGLLLSVKKALAGLDLQPYQVLFVSGIGQAAKAPHYLNCNFFNGLHGRSLPVATAAKLANHELVVIVESGDGCNYGEGGNHFLAALRKNPNLTMLVHDNQVYGLTKGQSSPTSSKGFQSKAQPMGNPQRPIAPLALALSQGCGFVARGFVGKIDHLAGLIQEAINYRGFALIDILQTCVSFNHVNTWKWYNERACILPEDYNPTDWDAAMKKSFEWGDKIPIGILYRGDEKPTLEDYYPALETGPLVKQKVKKEALQKAVAHYH